MHEFDSSVDAIANLLPSVHDSSIPDPHEPYPSQMQILHAQIKGSTMFAPTLPGRHTVDKMDGISWTAATYNQRLLSHLKKSCRPCCPYADGAMHRGTTNLLQSGAWD